MSKSEYSIVIPCHNEQDTIRRTVTNLVEAVSSIPNVDFVLVDNLSSDATWEQLQSLELEFKNVSIHKSEPRAGFGVAIRSGVASSTGSHIVFVMADGSEHPNDVAKFIVTSMKSPEACVFGDRFASRGLISGYPTFKRFLNRLVNGGLGLVFGTDSPDLTNGFKLYPRDVIANINPKSDDFSITLELSLGAICAGIRVITIPTSWRGREAGQSSFSLIAMALPYLSVITKNLWNRPHGREKTNFDKRWR
jgi:glycosyltransferase involved in cell wall biosynthesis